MTQRLLAPDESTCGGSRGGRAAGRGEGPPRPGRAGLGCRGFATRATARTRPGVHRGPPLLAQCGVEAPALSPYRGRRLDQSCHRKLQAFQELCREWGQRPQTHLTVNQCRRPPPGVGTWTSDGKASIAARRRWHVAGASLQAFATPPITVLPGSAARGLQASVPPRVASRGMPLPFRASGVIKLVTTSHVLEVLPRYQSLSSRDTARSLLPSGSATSSPFVHLHPSSSHLRKVRVVTARPVVPAPAPADGVRLRRSRASGPSVPGTRLHGPPRLCRTG